MAQNNQISIQGYFSTSCDSMKAFGRMKLTRAKSLTAFLATNASFPGLLTLPGSAQQHPNLPVLRTKVGLWCIFPKLFDPSAPVCVGIFKAWLCIGVTSGAFNSTDVWAQCQALRIVRKNSESWNHFSPEDQKNRHKVGHVQQFSPLTLTKTGLHRKVVMSP